MTSAVEARLWNIFTHYTLHGDPLDPNHLNAYQFLKLTKDCKIVSPKGLRLADVHVTFASEVKKASNKDGGKTRRNLLTYAAFLNSLVQLSKKVYPEDKNVEDTFQAILKEHILPNASHRKPESIEHILKDPRVVELFEYYEKPLYDIFQFYASKADEENRRDLFLVDDSSSIVRQYVNSMKECLSYNDFLKFAKDFSLSSTVLLTTFEMADIFLSSMKVQSNHGVMRKIAFVEFWECLVRCAMTAHDKVCDAPPCDKIKGMFLFMWRSLQQRVPRAIEVRRDVSIYSGNLLAGAMCFANRFTAQWKQDNYRDYLATPKPQVMEAKGLLKKILLSNASNSMLLDSLEQGKDAENASHTVNDLEQKR